MGIDKPGSLRFPERVFLRETHSLNVMNMSLKEFDWTNSERWNLSVTPQGRIKISVRPPRSLNYYAVDYSDYFDTEVEPFRSLSENPYFREGSD